MVKFTKERRSEILLVFACIGIYVTRRLFQQAHAFDGFIYHLEKNVNGLTLEKVWRAFDNYSHFWNVIFPVAGGGILFFCAWYVFHIWLVPKLKSIELSASKMLLVVFVLFLAFLSVFVHNYFRLYYRTITTVDPEIIVGVKVFSLFRKLFLFTDSIAVIVILIFYEFFAQLYYFIIAKLKEEQNNAFISKMLTGVVVVIMIFWAFFANLPQKDYWYGGIKELFMITICVSTVFFAQNFFYQDVLPTYEKPSSRAFKLGSFKFIFTLLVGTFAVYLILFVGWRMYAPVSFGWNSKAALTVFPVLMVGAIFVSFLRKFFVKERTQLETEVSQKTAELGQLRSQINPHFLFNALNTLYSVSLRENAVQTSDGIQKLGDMMRFMLHENHQDRIPLAKELEYLNNFIEIQRMRLDESQDIKIEVNIQDADREIFVAPMLLNPFVENAFKHGISFREASWIYITLTHDAQCLYFKVHNSLHPKSVENLSDHSHGIGLDNVKKRLELIYPNRHSLEIQKTDQDYFVSLVLGVY